MTKENNIIKVSWDQNAEEWIALLDRRGIPSRKITNPAIIGMVMDMWRKGEVLDLGCGEGWLTRALSSKGVLVTGVDSTQALIGSAQLKSSDPFKRMSYEDIIRKTMLEIGPFDIVVCNYSLYGMKLTENLFKTLKKKLLRKNGILVIQTVHPEFLIQDGNSTNSRWVEDAWSGLDGNFTTPHRWYARTKKDWLELFEHCGYGLIECRETTAEKNRPLSILFSVKCL